MKILNVMLGRGLGGIEQAFLDYSLALSSRAEVISVVHSKAAIIKDLQNHNLKFHTISPLNNWDPFAMAAASRLISQQKVDVVICHGGRAFAIFHKAARSKNPVIALAHNYSFPRILNADAIFAITNDIKNKLVELGAASTKVFHVPNCIDSNIYNPRSNSDFQSPPVIGAIGRHVKKKGFDVFIKALELLKNQGVSFKAILAGNGEETDNLKALANTLGLNNCLEFVGWVENKQSFFNSIDLLCLPSLHEPFGIVVLEAMAAGVPIISTKSEGPNEILENEKDAIMVEINSESEITAAINRLISHPEIAKNLALKALEKVKKEYDMNVSGDRIIHAAGQTISNFHNKQ